MPDLDVKLVQQQILAAAERIIELPRHPRGYQGLITVEDVIVVVAVRGEDGQVRYVDPAEVSDGKPDCFVRDFVRIPNGRRGTGVAELLQRFLPVFAPQAAGLLDWLFKKVRR